ncbi:MAG TPA: hypothetical protein VMS88_00960, partial [Terriglobales bacterium]|nr:hypothetical protein [Terriglobales bacterium]
MNRIFTCVALAAITVAMSPGARPATPEAFVPRHLDLTVTLDYDASRLSGSATYELENWTRHPASRVSLLLNRLMLATGVRDAAGRRVPFDQDVRRFEDMPMRQVTQVVVHFARPVPPGGRATVRIDYHGNLTGYEEVGWLYVHDHIDTTFTILRTDALAFPDVGGLSDAANRSAPRASFVYDASVRVPARLVVATGGRPTRIGHDDGTVTWRYQSGRPSPFLNLCIAPYDTLSRGAVRVFYFPADSAGGRRLMSAAESAMATYRRWFGPLRETPEVCVSEIPDGWGSQADAVGGIIQSAAAFRDRHRLFELYHELSHLWNVEDTDSPSPRWNEGLASFLENLMMEELDGWTRRAAADSSTIVWLKGRLAADTSLSRVPLVDYGRRSMTDWSYSVGGILFAT